MSISTGEEMLLNFDGWLAKQDEATKGGLTQQLNTVPDDQRPIEKQRLGAMVRIGEEHPELDAATINDQWHLIRGGYAERRGGDWNAVKDDEPAFLGKMVSDATQQRDERHLLQGLDDTKAPEAQAAWDSSLLNRASEAAYAGKSYADALGDWQDTAKGKPGYAQERTAKYEDLARTAHARMTGMVAKVRPLAEQAFEQIAQARGVKEGEGDSAPFALLRGLAPQEKELAFRVMTDKAGNSGADKLSTEAFLEGVGRGFENLVIGGGAAAFRSRLLQSRFTEGDLVTRGNALDEVASDYTADSVMRSSVGSGGAGFARAQEKAKGRKLTADEAKTWNAQLDVAREDLDTAEQLRKFGQQVIDPTNKAGGAAFQKVMLPAADSLAIMASLAIPGTWAPALELGARSYQGEEYTRL